MIKVKLVQNPLYTLDLLLKQFIYSVHMATRVAKRLYILVKLIQRNWII